MIFFAIILNRTYCRENFSISMRDPPKVGKKFYLSKKYRNEHKEEKKKKKRKRKFGKM
jgi:hypothetical protein